MVFRHGDKYIYNPDIRSHNYKKYVYTPTINNEDMTTGNDHKYYIDRFGDNTVVQLYEYNKQMHIDKSNKVCKTKFVNQWFQQGYRLFSFFYNVRGVLNLIKNDDPDPDDIILLTRLDIGVNIINESLIHEYLNDCDILLIKKVDLMERTISGLYSNVKTSTLL